MTKATIKGGAAWVYKQRLQQKGNSLSDKIYFDEREARLGSVNDGA
jgi:hypothetical protein